MLDDDVVCVCEFCGREFIDHYHSLSAGVFSWMGGVACGDCIDQREDDEYKDCMRDIELQEREVQK